MKKPLLFIFLFLSIISLHAETPEYTEPQDVSTTEGLPSSLVNGSVCAITGEYTDSVVDVVLPGPEPLVISRVYTSFSRSMPWSLNHYDELIIGHALYGKKDVYIIGLRQPSGSQLDYICEKNKKLAKYRQFIFNLVVPKGLTNGASMLSGKTNLKNQTLEYFPDEKKIVSTSGSGNLKLFTIRGESEEGWPLYAQISEEKINGSRMRYIGRGKGISGASKYICENKKTEKQYSFIEFDLATIDKETKLQTMKTSDGRALKYYFNYDEYKVKEKEKNRETSYYVGRHYLTKVDHSYSPPETYDYAEKGLSKDKQLVCKSRDKGRRFVNIKYYHKGANLVQGPVGVVNLDKKDFRMDRVKILEAPVGTDETPIVTHRFDYHYRLKEDKEIDSKTIKQGYTDVYDAYNHKTSYSYDRKHRLTSITHYTGNKEKNYAPYSEESFVWDNEGSLIAKYFKDGAGNIHHARLFTYDSNGNVTTSTLCGKLTGNSSPSLQLDHEGENLIENGYEREIKTYTYSKDGLNLLLSEEDSAGKKIEYKYNKGSDLLAAKYLSYDGKIRLREFYYYDENNALEKKILDDGCREKVDDLVYVNERHYAKIFPKKEAPGVGLPERSEDWFYDFERKTEKLLKRSTFTYFPEGRVKTQQVFDANSTPAFLLQWNYDSHGNLISETDPMGITKRKRYDLATDNLIEEAFSDISVTNTYDFANRLIEQKTKHPHHKFVTSNQYDYLSNCTSIKNAYGHETLQQFDDFGRVIETHYPEVLHEGVLERPVIKTEYDIAGFPISITDANGYTTLLEVNIRGQATKITYPDGTHEEMKYSLDGHLMEKVAKNGTHTVYERDPLGRITQEIVYGLDKVKKTTHTYNSLHLKETKDPEGNITKYNYDWAGRLRETIRHDSKVEQFYDPLGRVSEIREYFGKGPNEYRATIRKYDNLDRIKEEHLQTAEGHILHSSYYGYDLRGNRILAQTGDQKVITEYNTLNQPTKIIDGLGHETHIDYNYAFLNPYGQKVLQKTTTDPLGYRTLETYDAADRVAEIVRINPFNVKVARQAFYYDLAGNHTKTEEDVMEEGKITRSITTLFSYNCVGQLVQTIEAKGTNKQKITEIQYNSVGQKEKILKPDGIQLVHTYDEFERLKTLASTDKSIVYVYEYNLLDQALSVTDLTTGKATRREYHQGNIKREMLANGLTLDFAYDLTGRAKTIQFPDQTGLEYVYNAVDLKEIHRLKNGQRMYTHADLEHSISGQVKQARSPGNNGVVAYQYGPAGHCLSIESTVFKQHIPANGLDKAGNIIKFEMQKTPYEFAYDDHNQVKSEKGHCTHSYTFDSICNRTSKDGEKYENDDLNQLMKRGSEELKYDLNGNLTHFGPYKYTYDALNRLVRVEVSNRVVSYAYDAFDRRITKTENGEEELFLYQGQDEIGRWKNGICQEVRLMGKNPLSQTAAIEIHGNPYIPFHDMKGNIIALTDLQGNLIEQYRYSVYGEREILSATQERLVQSKVGNPWQYVGKRIDEETGLIAFGMRYYSPALGRWTTPDPAGFEDGSNLYAYVHNNPLQFSDRYGLLAEFVYAGYLGCKAFAGYEYNKFRTNLDVSFTFDSPSIEIAHVDMETKFANDYNFRKKDTDQPFERTGKCCINDNIKTGEYFKELPFNKKIVYICGIGNTKTDFIESQLHLANLSGGYNLEGIFCPTMGKILDSMCYFHAKDDYVAYEGTRELYKEIVNFHLTRQPGATMLIIAHSRGCVYTRNALLLCSQELRDRVEVCAIAPGGYIDDHLCKRVVHYASTKDPVPRLDRAGRKRCKDTIISLTPAKGASWNDHTILSDTYSLRLRDVMERYLTK